MPLITSEITTTNAVEAPPLIPMRKPLVITALQVPETPRPVAPPKPISKPIGIPIERPPERLPSAKIENPAAEMILYKKPVTEHIPDMPYPELRRFIHWLEDNDVEWDYARFSPTLHLMEFDARSFRRLSPTLFLLEQSDTQVTDYFHLPEQVRYELFIAMPATTTKHEWITAVCKWISDNTSLTEGKR